VSRGLGSQPSTRAAPGLRPGPLRGPARSWLTTVRLTPNADDRLSRCAWAQDGEEPKRDKGSRDFFLSFLAAKSVGVSIEDFRDEMEGRDETEAFLAWRKACAARSR
jgi:hypothetical protein